MYCPAGENVIAIVPQIGTGGMPATASSPQASNTAKEPFSAVLEQAGPFGSDSLSDSGATTGTAGKGSYSPVSTLSKREAKTSDFKSSDLKSSDSKANDAGGRGNSSSQAPASSLDEQHKTFPAVVVPTLSLPTLTWSMELEDLTADTQVTGAVNDKETSSSSSGAELDTRADASSASTSWPTLSGDPVATKAGGDAWGQDLPNTASAKATSESVINAELSAGLNTKSSGTVSDLRTQPDVVPAHPQARGASRGPVETSDGASKAQAAARSEIDQFLVAPTGVSVAPASPSLDPGKSETGMTRGTETKPVSNKSKLDMKPESVGATQSNVEITAGSKAQTRKDDSQSSSSSQAVDPSALSTPAKAFDSLQVFSVAATQTSTTAGDGKIATVSVPHEAGDPQSGQLDQKSTGAAQSQMPGETVASYPTSVVHSAKLVERIGEAELRLGIRAGEFGNVDIRTSMVRNQFTAEISVERGELGRVMAAELPGLQSRLSEQRVPVANITVQNHSGSQSSASEQQKPRDGQPAYATNPVSAQEKSPMSALVAFEATTPTSGLDIHM
jgi:flagellar hook-length control protein FliK